MQLYNPDTTPLIDIQVDDSSYAYNTVMGRDDLTLNFALNGFIELPLGVYCLFLNRKYSLTNDSNFKMINTQNFTYQLLLDAPIAYAKQTKFKFVTLDKNPDGSVELNTNPKIKFSLTGRPVDFLNLWVDCMNLNDKEGGWTVGECLESEEVTLDFNNQWCYDVLADFAEAFDTEWEADGKTMHLRRVEKMKDNPLLLSYGMGNGLLSGLERKVSKAPVSRVWIETSERNIDSSVYGSDTLRMKKNQTIVYEGIEYVTDPTGSYLERKEPLIVANIVPEDSIDLTKIYPSHVGTVSSVEVINDEKGVYAIVDTSNMINYRDVVIAGEKATLIFQSGQLTGKEFEFNYNHTLKRFQLNPINENGLLYPHGTLIPEAGDKYAVFHISLPQEYIDEAEEKALNETVKYLYENEPPKYLYTAPVSELYAKRNWGLIGDRLNTGYFVRLSDDRFLPEGVDIRIVEVTRYVNKPMQPKIGLSDDVIGVRLGSELNKIDNQEQTIDRKQQETYRVIKRTWANVQELINAMYDPSGSFQEQILSSVVLHAMMGVFGDETLQYQFLSEDWQTVIEPVFSFDPETRKFHAPASHVRHMTMGIDSVQPDRPEGQYKHWQINEYLSDVLTDTEKGYYLYMQCSKDLVDVDGRMQGTGQFLISETKIALEDAPGMYTFWVGFLSSENDEGDRSLRTVYGFTEILPGQMTVDNIFSSDGLSYWKLIANQFKIPGLDWNVTRANALTLLNAYFSMINSLGETVVNINGEDGSAMFAKGNALFNADGSVNITGLLQSNNNGNRIIVDPTDRSIKMLDSNNNILAKYEFFSDTETQYNGARITLKGQSEGEESTVIILNDKIYVEKGVNRTTLYADGIQVTTRNSDNTGNAANSFITNDLIALASSDIRVYELPTSSTGLELGQIWNDNGTLKVVT